MKIHRVVLLLYRVYLFFIVYRKCTNKFYALIGESHTGYISQISQEPDAIVYSEKSFLCR